MEARSRIELQSAIKFGHRLLALPQAGQRHPAIDDGIAVVTVDPQRNVEFGQRVAAFAELGQGHRKIVVMELRLAIQFHRRQEIIGGLSDIGPCR